MRVFERWVVQVDVELNLLGLAVLNCARSISSHQRPASLLEVRRDVTAAPVAVASLIHHMLVDSATITTSAVEEHDVLALAHEFHVGIGAGFRA
jgi:hypothetical protein